MNRLVWISDLHFSKINQPEIIWVNIDENISDKTNDNIDITVVFDDDTKGWCRVITTNYLEKLIKSDQFFWDKNAIFIDEITEEKIIYIVELLDKSNQLLDVLIPYKQLLKTKLVTDMPIYPPRNEPNRKIEVLEKREMELLKCIRTNSSAEKTSNKAKKVKDAQLNLVKTRLALIKPYKHGDKTEHKEQLKAKLEKEMELWQNKSITTIIAEYKE